MEQCIAHLTSLTAADLEGEAHAPLLEAFSRLRSPTSPMEQCIAHLSSLTATDLEGEAHAPLLEAGCRLFKAAVLRREFGRTDVVGFLQDQHEQRNLLKQLEKLEKKIDEQHSGRVRKAKFAGINTQRQESWMSIQAGEMPTALMDAPTTGLLESKVVGALQAPQAESAAGAAETTGAAAEAAGGPAAPAGSAAGEAAADSPADTRHGIDMDAVRRAAALPPGSFRQCCNICGATFEEFHHFYHQLCAECSELNWAKRIASPDMRGKVAVVTGGRVRIGFHTVLKLLRAGCTVLTTTRYPADAAARYGREPDFGEWSDRLEVMGPLDLCDLGLTERFCDALAQRFERIDVLVNNAAQTLTRAPGWFDRMDRMEEQARASLPPAVRQLLLDSAASPPGRLLMGPDGAAPEQPAQGAAGGAAGGAIGGSDGAAGAASEEGLGVGAAPRVTTSCDALAGSVVHGSARYAPAEGQLTSFFPAGKLDESQQPLDLSPINSWSRKLGQVGTSEILHTMAANAVAPFVLCARLRELLAPKEPTDGWGHIVNVNALEGKFSVTKKQSCHPHTNMAKAALNMLTCTAATDLAQSRILINSVDTGWVTDMAPGGVGVLAALHQTQVGPPLDEVDGAARVLDPIFMHARDNGWVYRGKLWKDYRIVRW